VSLGTSAVKNASLLAEQSTKKKRDASSNWRTQSILSFTCSSYWMPLNRSKKHAPT
jgi:hypothetical protein